MKYDYSKIAEYCIELKKINNNMKKYLGNVKKEIKTVNSNWTGSAADKYISKINKLSLEFTKFSKELELCVLYLQKCSSNYEKVDKEIKKNISKTLATSKFFR